MVRARPNFSLLSPTCDRPLVLPASANLSNFPSYSFAKPASEIQFRSLLAFSIEFEPCICVRIPEILITRLHREKARFLRISACTVVHPVPPTHQQRPNT